MSVNRCTFIGNLCKDPEVRYMPNGEAVANASIACNEVWKDKSGDKHESVEFINLVFYRKLAEVAGEWLKKGQQIYVEGKMKTRKWEKDGVTRYSTDIIVDEMQMLGGKKESSQAAQEGRGEATEVAAAPTQHPTARTQSSGSFDSFDDDLPF